jgi:hypothetical protein
MVTSLPIHFRKRRENGWGTLTVFIDPAQKICIGLPHPSDKNKGVARVGHPNGVAIHKDRINSCLINRA